MATHARQLAIGASRKRKERESLGGPVKATAKAKAEPILAPTNNRLLAGCLAHEFLRMGTLFGKPWPNPAETVQQSNPARTNPIMPSAEPERAMPAHFAVARLMRADGVHVPGVVNPTQLATWLKK